jgi:hypothetical protein
MSRFLTAEDLATMHHATSVLNSPEVRAWTYTDSRNYPSLIIAIGRAKKAKHLSFGGSDAEERRAKHIQDAYDAELRRTALRKDQQAERVAFKTTLKSGDILLTVWGYDQTNTDYFQVIEVAPSGKSVTLRPLVQNVVETGFMSGHSTPRPNEFTGPAFKQRVQPGNIAHLASYKSAHPYDGKPQSCTWYA